MATLITCKEGYETILANEIASHKGEIKTKGRGWIVADWSEQTLFRKDNFLNDPCFGYLILENVVKVSAASVNSLTDQLVQLFTTHIASLKIVAPWPLFFSCSEDEGLVHRVKIIERNWLDKLQKKMSRVAKLVQKGIPVQKPAEGCFVHFIDFDQAYISFQAFSAGQQRMEMDEHAPSRSYLKLEEAFRIFGYEPQKNDIVIDLGAAPGGWSYSAITRGAIVTAIDKGPLKGVVAKHPKMTHLKSDALKYKHDQGRAADWLLCDMLDKPEIVLDLVFKWLNQKWCRYFIVNIKVGRNNPIVLLKQIRDEQKGLAPYCEILQIRQLYHDREEITLMGKVKETNYKSRD